MNVFSLSGHDNNSYMLGEDTFKVTEPEQRKYFDWRFSLNGKQHPSTCLSCGRKIDDDYVNPEFLLRKKSMDISSTYDGYTIVSSKFKSFIESKYIPNIEFVSLPSAPDHYWMRVHSIIKVDKEKSQGIRFLYYCDDCETYAGVFGTSMLRFQDVGDEFPSGIYRTDLLFAQSHEQHPVLLVDPELAKEIKEQNFKGTCLNQIK
jgi:hypothetical protein